VVAPTGEVAVAREAAHVAVAGEHRLGLRTQLIEESAEHLDHAHSPEHQRQQDERRGDHDGVEKHRHDQDQDATKENEEGFDDLRSFSPSLSPRL
jgi:hypothetical protein